MKFWTGATIVLKPKEYCDISGMTIEEAKKIFPQLRYKNWMLDKYTLLFCDEYADIDAYSSDEDKRNIWRTYDISEYSEVSPTDIGELWASLIVHIVNKGEL